MSFKSGSNRGEISGELMRLEISPFASYIDDDDHLYRDTQPPACLTGRYHSGCPIYGVKAELFYREYFVAIKKPRLSQ
jgi:hypothetical protein